MQLIPQLPSPEPSQRFILPNCIGWAHNLLKGVDGLQIISSIRNCNKRRVASKSDFYIFLALLELISPNVSFVLLVQTTIELHQVYNSVMCRSPITKINFLI